MFSRSKTTYRERVWTERHTVTVHDELKDFNTRCWLLFWFFLHSYFQFNYKNTFQCNRFLSIYLFLYFHL